MALFIDRDSHEQPQLGAAQRFAESGLISTAVAGDDATMSGLIVHGADPLNCETVLSALVGGVVMPNARFYVRNHFGIPRLEPGAWRLEVGGLVHRPLTLGLEELVSMRSQTTVATLECAGNGRALFCPPIPGEQWDLGAVSTAEWTGVPLAALLERCGAKTSAREVVFRGADIGRVPGRPAPVRYERSLSLEDARRSGAVLAYAMNGEPLPIHHGHPLRLVVPAWFAMASVKWLTEIELIDHTFEGHFQAETYVYEDRQGARRPVRLKNVRSVITEPVAGERHPPGPMMIRGLAWSGAAPIAKVEVSVDQGPWTEACLLGAPNEHGWRRWEVLARTERSGPTSLRARATDGVGRSQPVRAEWNRLGYGNNAIHELVVHVG